MNFFKSILGGVGVDQTEILDSATIQNCEVRTPFKHLGMPVGGCHKRGDFWDEMVNRVKRRLDRWKGRCISMPKRICLIKYVLYFTIQTTVYRFEEDRESAEEVFWGWGSEGRKIAWVSWDKVCKSREAGGLTLLMLNNLIWLCWKNGVGV